MQSLEFSNWLCEQGKLETSAIEHSKQNYTFRPILKNIGLPCSYLPTQNRPYPPKNIAFLRIFSIFFSNSVNKLVFKIIKSCIWILKKGYIDCYCMHSYLWKRRHAMDGDLYCMCEHQKLRLVCANAQPRNRALAAHFQNLTIQWLYCMCEQQMPICVVS